LAFLSVTLPKIPGGCAPWTPLGVRGQFNLSGVTQIRNLPRLALSPRLSLIFALRWEGLLSRAGTLYQCWAGRRSTTPRAKARQAGPRYRCSSATFLADVGGPGADGASEQAATSPGREPRSRSRIRAAASSRSSAVIAVVLRSASLAPPPPPPPSLPSALAPPPRASPARRSMRSSCH
jgi:hypothetical protein